MQWKSCNIAMAITPETLSIPAFAPPVGTNFQIRVNMIAVKEKEQRKDSVGHGLLVPRAT